MNKQQTAVEWYANRLCDIEIAYNQGVIDTEVYVKSKTHAYEQAKEMEKQQIVKGVNFGTNQWVRLGVLNGEEYYKKTYGGNK